MPVNGQVLFILRKNVLSKEVFMAIRALYEIKDAPLALIVDMYKNAMVPSIA